ncbi:MAG TPA: heparan-alpha-glucosaminide N-acetyltransferase domain-containing protein [Holophagaceae bacterium]|nr:heparan-alpha-glucosaminide N-acetyltransferase domain-containing protein [Holophagaceae bacterium]
MNQTSSLPTVRASRIESIDLLRGVVMILMALDHVRHYFHADSMRVSPTDLHQTSGALFATRWITHFCAPTFIFLAGTSAHFIAQRKTPHEVSRFLASRGAWLVLLQMTLIRFAWNFDPGFHFNSSTIISTIGFSMIALAFLIHLRRPLLLAVGGAMVLGHNLLDGITFPDGSVRDVLWTFLHGHKAYDLGHGYSFYFLYPLLPWIGVMALGYAFGGLYDPEVSSAARKRALLRLGALSLVGFGLLRGLNVYGDPRPWSAQGSFGVTFMSFMNVEKYPPSLLFLAATLGVSFLFLGVVEGRSLARWRPVVVFGRVALFYYVAHAYLIHLLAMALAVAMGHPWQAMVFLGTTETPWPQFHGAYGVGLGAVYLMWTGMVLALYPLCRAWNDFKGRHRARWWVSYV